MKKVLLEDVDGAPCYIGHTDPSGFARERFVFVQISGNTGWFTAERAHELAEAIHNAAKELGK